MGARGLQHLPEPLAWSGSGCRGDTAGPARGAARREVERHGLLLGARSAPRAPLRGVIRRGARAAGDEGPASLAEWQGAAWWGCDRERQTERAPD